jgi:hypothetical protein
MRLHLSLFVGVLAGCDSRLGDPVPCDLGGAHAVVATTTTKFETGALAAVSDDGCVADTLSLTSGDAVVRATGDRLWVLNRTGGGGLLAYAFGDYQHPVLEVGGLQADNPHDIVEHDGQLFVSLYERNEVVVLDPATGDPIGTVDVSEHADADGLAEVDVLRVVDGQLYVSVQRLDRRAAGGWTPAGPGRLLQIDTDSLSVVAAYDVGENPFVTEGADGLVVLSGIYFQPDGVLSVFDPLDGVEDVLTEVDVGIDFGDQAVGVAVGTSFEVGGDSVVGCWADGDWREATRSAAWFSDAVAMDGRALLAARQSWGGAGEPGLWVVDPADCQPQPWGGPTLLQPSSVAWMTP